MADRKLEVDMAFFQTVQDVVGWKAQGWRLVSMRTLLDTLQPLALPRCEVGPGTIEGRSGTLLLQRDEFLADVDLAAAA